MEFYFKALRRLNKNMSKGDEIVNLEIKARIVDIEEKRKIIEAIGGKICNIREEIDTYFNTKKGTSLKAKQMGGNLSLLYYKFDPVKKISNFKTIENLNNISALVEILKDILEVKSIISKKKTIYKYNDSTVSFSEIEGFGIFVELQIAVKNNVKSLDRAQRILEDLRKILGIKEEDIETHGYGDIVCKIKY